MLGLSEPLCRHYFGLREKEIISSVPPTRNGVCQKTKGTSHVVAERQKPGFRLFFLLLFFLFLLLPCLLFLLFFHLILNPLPLLTFRGEKSFSDGAKSCKTGAPGLYRIHDPWTMKSQMMVTSKTAGFVKPASQSSRV